LAGWFWRPALIAAIGLGGLYALAVVAVSLFTACRTELKLFPVLPIVFGCFHIGYGYGFLRGFLDFVVRQKAPAAGFVQLTRKERRSASTV
jgi:hypothetical protein